MVGRLQNCLQADTPALFEAQVHSVERAGPRRMQSRDLQTRCWHEKAWRLVCDAESVAEAGLGTDREQH